MKNPLITDIQRYSIHDGNGIRTTVFFKGCPLRCKWCHNPETQSFSAQIMWKQEACRGCLACVEACSSDAVSASGEGDDFRIMTDPSKCSGCGNCAVECIYNARSVAGTSYGIDELMKILKKDIQFFENSGGGVTLSGGEAAAQNIEYVAELAKKLFANGISLNIDTCGEAPFESFERLLHYTDTFLYDIKCMDREKHKKYTGSYNDLILENLRRLSAKGARISIRLPMIPGVNMGDEDARAVIDYLKANNINPVSVHLLPYHELGRDKRERLGDTEAAGKFKIPSIEDLEHIKEMYVSAGYTPVQIGG